MMSDIETDVYVKGAPMKPHSMEPYSEVVHKIVDKDYRGLLLSKPIVVTSINGSEFVEIQVSTIELLQRRIARASNWPNSEIIDKVSR